MKLPAHEDRIEFEREHGVFLGEIDGKLVLMHRGRVLDNDDADEILTTLLKVEAEDDLDRRVIGFLVARKLRGEK